MHAVPIASILIRIPSGATSPPIRYFSPYSNMSSGYQTPNVSSGTRTPTTPQHHRPGNSQSINSTSTTAIEPCVAAPIHRGVYDSTRGGLIAGDEMIRCHGSSSTATYTTHTVSSISRVGGGVSRMSNTLEPPGGAAGLHRPSQTPGASPLKTCIDQSGQQHISYPADLSSKLNERQAANASAFPVTVSGEELFWFGEWELRVQYNLLWCALFV